MKILSIETSCDDTAITIFEAKGTIKNPRPKNSGGQASFKILANTSNSQINIHAQYGGVFPALAKREHIKNLPILLQDALEKSKLDKKKKPIDLIAVTYGPGLEPSLWTGIVFAKELSEKYLPTGRQVKIPIIPVNHMEGHIMSVFGKSEGSFKIPKVNFPVLSLLVSGGHTELILSKDWLNYKIIGETLDDAAGEAYDKVARMMDIPYPGGPKISKLAEEERNASPDAFVQVLGSRGPLPPPDHSQKHTGSAKNFSFALPRPMIYSKNFDFSFSGLKTAVLYLIRDLKKENPNILQDEKVKQAIALEFENAVVETLIHKTKKAIEKYKPKTLIVAGGVSCNEHLQREMKKYINKDITLLFPEKKLTGDNSIMIGIAGYLQYLKNNKKISNTKSIKAKGNLRF